MQTYGDMELMFPQRSDWTLRRVLSTRAETHGDQVFLSAPGIREVTFAEMADHAARLGNALRMDGLSVGDRLVILSDSRVEYVEAWFAAAWAGLVEVPISPYYRGTGLRRLITTVEPAAAICEPRLVEELIGSSAIESVPRVYLLSGPDRDDARRRLSTEGVEAEDFESLYEAPAGDGHRRAPHELASVLFTSGTTGLPKGVRMPEAQLYFFSEQFRNYEELTDTDVYLHDKPMYTSLAHFHVVYASLIAGATVALYDSFSAQRWARRVHESGASVVLLLGEMMDFVMKQPPDPIDDDNHLRCISCGPTSWRVADDFLERFGGEALAEAFGQTETCNPIMTPYGAKRPKGACGLAVDDWFEVRLADPDTDEAVEQGEPGELQIRHRVPWTISDGYYGADDATAKSRRNLWFHTGDILRRDDDGWFYFIDRSRDVLRRRGHNISSREIEQAFMQRDDVVGCAAINIPPSTSGADSAEILVTVVTREDADTPQAMLRFVEQHLPYYSVPRYVRFLDELPLTPTGKVRKVELREMGLDGEVWDRQAEGMVLKEEAARAQKRDSRTH